ncbi:MAG TPA: WXG100 family type VII secretion target [Mycobacterium sp.]|nr:WXG100 family type VII secretion target [Mycobacterium sp.]
MHAAMVLRADVEQLVTAAVQVARHGEELAATHLAADNRLESAAPGWAGRSAAALDRRAELWREQSNRLVARVGGHASGLHSSACEFSAMELANSVALGAPSSPTAGAGAAAPIR